MPFMIEFQSQESSTVQWMYETGIHSSFTWDVSMDCLFAFNWNLTTELCMQICALIITLIINFIDN